MVGQIAVADTSVIVALHYLRLLTKLSLFYREVLIPTQVRNEFIAKDEKGNLVIALNQLIAGSLFSPCDDYDSTQVAIYLTTKLHKGESEALSQMDYRNADVLLIDERRARKIARREMRTVRGTADILAELDKMGYVNYQKSIDLLRDGIHFRISDTIAEEIYRKSMGQ
ncbi:MAG: hypothetical protein ACHQQQ_03350 [Bacteroidota bacterium]